MAINIRVMEISAHGSQEVVSALQLAMDFMGTGQAPASDTIEAETEDHHDADAQTAASAD